MQDCDPTEVCASVVETQPLKTLIAIEGCEAHFDRYAVQLETWAYKQPDVVYFTGPGLGVPDDYQHLPEKTRAICDWATHSDYDYLFKCDTDTYVSVPRLLASGFENYDYSGYILDWLGFSYCSGPHYWLSRKAFETLATGDWTLAREDVAPRFHLTCEDVMVGYILKKHGILPHHDERYAPFRQVLPDNDVISEHITSRDSYSHDLMRERHRMAHDR